MDNDHQDLIAENIRLFRRIIELERVGDGPTDAMMIEHLSGQIQTLLRENEGTIERCAQAIDAVARTVTMDIVKTAFEEAAAIVRALKDK